jgi:hypothetical protein
MVPTLPPPVFPKIDAWPLQTGPGAPQEARTITKTRSRHQQLLHRGFLEGLEKCHHLSLRPPELFIILTVGEQSQAAADLEEG